MLQCRCSVAQAIQRNWQAYLCSLNKQQFFGIVRKGHYSSIFKELSTRMVLGSWLFTCNKLNVKISCSCNFLGIPKQKNNHVRLNWANIKSYLSNRPHVLWVYRRDSPLGMLGEWSLLGKKYGFSAVIKSCLLSKVIISQSGLTI